MADPRAKLGTIKANKGAGGGSKDANGKNGLAITIPTELIEVMMQTAALAYSRGNLDDALGIYDGVVLARPDWSRPLVGKAAILFRRGDLDGAEKAYRAALALNPKDGEAHLYWGEFLWQARANQEQAKEHLMKALELDPKGPAGSRAQIMLKLVNEKK